LHKFTGALGKKMEILGAKQKKGGAMLTPINSFLLFGVFTFVQILAKINQEMRP